MKSTKIQILDPREAQQIAAGEVIERPANIVKELLENSIDAGATSITVHIEKAGKTKISVADNGCGMSKADATLCFARHATSKIRSVHDLTALTTLGFRGEALASIAAVSSVTLTTKEHDEPLLGTSITYRHGIQTTCAEQTCPPGTTITIENLFDALPVRKAFLKQDDTEWHQIQTVLYGIALTHLGLSLTVYKDTVLLLQAPAVRTLQERITQLWGTQLSKHLTAVHTQERGITITGLVSTPPYARYGKDLMFLWANNRLIKNSDLCKAIIKGYHHALPYGKFPAAFLAISVEGSDIDVNIHPRKEEVRFTKPGVLATLTTTAVTAALERAPDFAATPFAAQRSTPLSTQIATNYTPPLRTAPVQQPMLFMHPSHMTPPVTPPQPQAPWPASTPATKEIVLHSFRFVGQLFATYLLFEGEDEYIIVDQHAAHERILYHKYTTIFTHKEGTQLLFPETIMLASTPATEALLQVADFFQTQGIAYQQTGPMHVTITSAPPQLQKESLQNLLADAADFVMTHRTLNADLFQKRLNEHVHSHLACKLAIKAGDVLDQQTATELIKTLLATPLNFMCIHGRPTVWRIQRSDLDKHFKRK